jgi:hypothetical protein
MRCTNPVCQVTHAPKFCTVAPNIYVSLVSDFLHVTLVALRIVRWLLDFQKMC